MVYLHDWEQYAVAVHDLYRLAPERTRFVVKYRHTDGKLVLKATDDFQCLKFRTDQMQDLKRFERLSRTLMGAMMEHDIAEYTEPIAPPPVSATAMTGAAGASGAGAGKKKKGKRR